MKCLIPLTSFFLVWAVNIIFISSRTVNKRKNYFRRNRDPNNKVIEDIFTDENIELKNYGAIYKDKNDKFLLSKEKIKDQTENLVAECYFNKVINDKGWDKLSINTYKAATAYQQAYLAGYLEGRMTSKEIFYFYNNLRVNNRKGKHQTSYDKMLEFFSKVAETFSKKVKMLKEDFGTMSQKDQKLWSRFIVGYSQLEGLVKGYTYEVTRLNEFKEKMMTIADFLILQADGEVPELLRYFKVKNAIQKNQVKPGDENYFNDAFGINTKDPLKFWGQLMWTSKCSAFIKLTTDKNGKWKDLLAGHTTWTEYYEMLRTYKHYNFQLDDKDTFKKTEMTFSSYPGCLSSTDDFYLTHNNLLVMETTLEVIDVRLYKNVKPPEEYIPNFIRVMAATRFAKSAKEWVEFFSEYNSGTYSSQWMILDYNIFGKIQNTTKTEPNLLFMMEQTPKEIITQDISDYLYNHKYFGSYNRAFLNETKMGLNLTLIKNLYGNRFGYSGANRAIIFNKMNELVNDIKTLKDILRYNGFKAKSFDEDPSNDNPGEGISSRYDLDMLGLNNLSGGIDCKVTNSELVKLMTSVAISGPTNENNKNLPIFDWSLSKDKKTIRDGVPQKFNFPYLLMSPKTLCCENKNDIYTFK